MHQIGSTQCYQFAMLLPPVAASTLPSCTGKGGSWPAAASSVTNRSNSPHSSLAVHGQRFITWRLQGGVNKREVLAAQGAKCA